MTKNSIYFRDIDLEVIEHYLSKNYKQHAKLRAEVPEIMNLKKLKPVSSLEEEYKYSHVRSFNFRNTYKQPES